jgi:hypothetical protein
MQDMIREETLLGAAKAHMKMPFTTCQNFTTATAIVKVRWTIWR